MKAVKKHLYISLILMIFFIIAATNSYAQVKDFIVPIPDNEIPRDSALLNYEKIIEEIPGIIRHTYVKLGKPEQLQNEELL